MKKRRNQKPPDYAAAIRFLAARPLAAGLIDKTDVERYIKRLDEARGDKAKHKVFRSFLDWVNDRMEMMTNQLLAGAGRQN